MERQSPSGRPVVDVIEEGVDLYTSDGENVGHIDEINPEFFIVSKGLLGRQQLYIPRTGNERQDGDRVYANLTRDEIESGDFSRPSESGWATDYDAGSEPASTGSAAAGTRIRRFEEELEAEKTAQEVGAVHVGKEVVEEQQTIDVPVTREEVRIQSRPVDREVGDTDEAFQSETISVPVMEEQVEVRKTPRVVEEVEVEKVARQDTERVSDTVRKERLAVDDAGSGRARTDGEGQ